MVDGKVVMITLYYVGKHPVSETLIRRVYWLPTKRRILFLHYLDMKDCERESLVHQNLFNSLHLIPLINRRNQYQKIY